MDPKFWVLYSYLTCEVQSDGTDWRIKSDSNAHPVLGTYLSEVVKGISNIIKSSETPDLSNGSLKLDTPHQKVLATNDFATRILGTKGLIGITANAPVPSSKETDRGWQIMEGIA